MKKKILLFICVCIPLSVVAQLKIDSLGLIRIGNGRSGYGVSAGALNLVNSTGDSCGISITNGDNMKYFSLRLYKKGDFAYIGTGAFGDAYGGFRMQSGGGTTLFSGTFPTFKYKYTPRFMVLAESSPGILVVGKKMRYDCAAIESAVEVRYASAMTFSGYQMDSSNVLTRTFYVKGDGTVYGKNGFIQSSDISKKENIDSISSDSAMTAISALRGVSFNYKEAKTSANTSVRTLSSKKTSVEAVTEGSEDQEGTGETISPEIQAQIEKEKSRKRIGLIAQEVEKVVPEVVRTLPDGSKGIMYTDLVALLVEGMKEIQGTIQKQALCIDSLKKEIAQGSIVTVSQSKNTANQSSDNLSLLNQQIVLYQNCPNPFSATTEIVYSVPDGLENISISIYNLKGDLIKLYSSLAKSGTITLQGAELDSGVYVYSLQVNNQVVASRKMVKE